MSAGERFRVLFVDDDVRLLDGVRRSMHAYRARWQVACALGGGEALSHLATESVDIVITDMRMPGIDGRLLLAEIARAHPQIIRIVLSGQTDSNAALRTMRVAHQFLAKPIAAPALAETIGRLCDMRALVGDVELRGRATAVNVLPASPDLYDEVTRLAADGSASIARFAGVIERDPAMTAKLLHLSGLTTSARPLRATGVTDLIGQLGLGTLRTIVDSGELAAIQRGDAALDREIVCQQQHAHLVARIARSIVPDRRLADDAYAAGLLHDIGKLVLLGQPAAAAHGHAEVGAYMLGIWGLPAGIVAAVADHHASVPAGETNLLAAVTHVANVLAHEYEGDDDCRTREALDETILGINGMSPLVASWRAIVTEERAVLSELPS